MKIVKFLNTIVSDCEETEILPCLQANKPLTGHDRLQKIHNSWMQEKRTFSLTA